MVGLYLACLIFGGFLIGVSLLLGGHDADHDADHDHDHDHDVEHDVDHDVEAEHDLEADHDHDHDHVGGSQVLADAMRADPASKLWLPFLSMRFWTFFAAAFGATGLLLTLFGLPDVMVAGIAAPNGLLIGTGAAWFFRQIKNENVTADTSLTRFIGQEAKVVLPVRPGDVGKIALQTMAGRFEMPATTRDKQALEPGSLVLVAHVADGVADVTSLTRKRKAGIGDTDHDHA